MKYMLPFGAFALAIVTTNAVRAEAPAVPSDAEQCMVMVEKAVTEQNSMNVSDPAVIDAFDLLIGEAVQNCDRKNFAGAADKVAEALASLPD